MDTTLARYLTDGLIAVAILVVLAGIAGFMRSRRKADSALRGPSAQLQSAQLPVKILPFTVDESALKRLSDRQRNQLFGCMHAHNELTFLNRLLLFSLTDVADGTLHDSAKSVQTWCLLQLLTGKLFETWLMVIERVLSGTPEDALVGALSSAHRASLAWLSNYFGGKQARPSPLKTVRDKTAFHYDGLNLAQPLKNLATEENRVYLAQHPANSLYYLGSAVVFRSIFAEIATAFAPQPATAHEDRVKQGTDIVMADLNAANLHMHQVLYGFIKQLLEQALGDGLTNPPEVINLEGIPRPDQIALPAWIQVGRP